MVKSRFALGVVAALLLVDGGVGSRASAQSMTDSAATVVEPAQTALLTELQGLREDIQRFAGTSIRVQLLLARLQLQEQRINTLGAQVADVRSQMKANATQQSEEVDHLKQYTSLLNSAPADFTLESLRDIQNSIPRLRENLQRLQREGQKLGAQEADLASQISTEQARWWTSTPAWTNWSGRFQLYGDEGGSLP